MYFDSHAGRVAWVVTDQAGTITGVVPGAQAFVQAHPGLQKLLAEWSREWDVTAGAGVTFERVLTNEEEECGDLRLEAVPLVRLNGAGSPRMLVRLGPAEDRHLSGDVLRARFGLSAAECRVAAAVAGGYGPSETARRLSLSIHTVRSHLKRIYQKLGVHSQTALVRLLLQASKGRCGTGE